MSIGIALGGGGAKGLAHIGVLQVLEDAGIPIAEASGASIGALIGAAWAAGKLDAVEETVSTLSVTDIPKLLSPTWSKQGFFSGRNALELVMSILGVERFEELEKPLTTVAVSIETGEEKFFSTGALREAIRASFAIPALFTPTPIGKELYVDGGVRCPLPISPLRSGKCQHIIAVDLFGGISFAKPGPRTADLWPEGIKSALTYIKSLQDKLFGSSESQPTAGASALHLMHIVERTLAIVQQELTLSLLKEHPADIVIRPEVETIGLLDFHRAEPVIERGRVAAKKALPEIKKLLTDNR